MKRTLPGFGDYWRLLRRSGFSRAWSYFWDNHFFDLRHGTDTAHWHPKHMYDQTLPNFEHGFRYEASYTSLIQRTIKIVGDVVPLEKYGFFDLGCGKGKALLVASRYPFVSVEGVEYAADLAAVARSNIARSGCAARVHEGDAAAFAGYTPRAVIFLFNPFDSVILEAVLRRLRELEDVIVIYCNPVHAEVFAGWPKLGGVTHDAVSRSGLIFRIPASCPAAPG